MDETSPLFRDVVQADRHNPLGAVIRAGYHDDECQSRQSHPSRQYQAESRTILQAVLSNYSSHHELDAVNPVDPRLGDNAVAANHPVQAKEKKDIACNLCGEKSFTIHRSQCQRNQNEAESWMFQHKCTCGGNIVGCYFCEAQNQVVGSHTIRNFRTRHPQSCVFVPTSTESNVREGDEHSNDEGLGATDDANFAEAGADDTPSDKVATSREEEPAANAHPITGEVEAQPSIQEILQNTFLSEHTRDYFMACASDRTDETVGARTIVYSALHSRGTLRTVSKHIAAIVVLWLSLLMAISASRQRELLTLISLLISFFCQQTEATRSISNPFPKRISEIRKKFLGGSNSLWNLLPSEHIFLSSDGAHAMLTLDELIDILMAWGIPLNFMQVGNCPANQRQGISSTMAAKILLDRCRSAVREAGYDPDIAYIGVSCYIDLFS